MLRKFVVVDVETTGLNRYLDRIIEIAIIKLNLRFEIEEEFSKYIDPEIKISNHSIKVHGITNASLAEQPKFKEISKDIVRNLKGNILVAHNSSFDAGFINNELQRAGKSFQVKEQFDTLSFAKKHLDLEANKLDNLVLHYKVVDAKVLEELRKRHCALDDARLLAKVFQKITKTSVFKMMNTIGRWNI